MAKKRSNGEGSIFKIADGSWRASITVRVDGLGRAKRKTVRGDTQKEIKEKLRVLLRLRHENALSDPSRMQKLTPLDIQQWQTHLLNTPRHVGSQKREPDAPPPPNLSPATVSGAMTLLGTALRHALHLGLIYRNPAEAVKRVKIPTREFTVWEPSEVQGLIEAVLGHRLYGLVYLALTTGLRRGELVGLRWSDIVRGVIHVQQSCVLVGNIATMTTPKTKASRRRVPLSPDTLEALRLHRDRQAREREAAGEDWRDHGLVFATSLGTVYHPRNLLRDWYALLEAHSVRRIRLHDIRHTYASLAIYQGLDPKVLADRLGHSRASISLDIYGHVFEEQRDRAALSLTQLVSRDLSAADPLAP